MLTADLNGEALAAEVFAFCTDLQQLSHGTPHHAILASFCFFPEIALFAQSTRFFLKLLLMHLFARTKPTTSASHSAAHQIVADDESMKFGT